jgi:DNA-binding transcriptional MerR regulator
MKTYSRQDLATELDIGIETLRYYEKVGLLKPPERSANGSRLYGEEDRDLVRRILSLKASGFTLREIRSLAKYQNPSNEEIAMVVKTKIAELDRKIDSLTQIRDGLEGFRRSRFAVEATESASETASADERSLY